MDLNLEDINGTNLKIGDTVRVIKVTDDSGNATDLFGVEPQLDGWVNIVYLETLEGVITYNSSKMMMVIKGKYTELPLSPDIRYNIFNNIFDRIDKTQIQEIADDLGIEADYEILVDYIEKIK